MRSFKSLVCCGNFVLAGPDSGVHADSRLTNVEGTLSADPSSRLVLHACRDGGTFEGQDHCKTTDMNSCGAPFQSCKHRPSQLEQDLKHENCTSFGNRYSLESPPSPDHGQNAGTGSVSPGNSVWGYSSSPVLTDRHISTSSEYVAGSSVELVYMGGRSATTSTVLQSRDSSRQLSGQTTEGDADGIVFPKVSSNMVSVRSVNTNPSTELPTMMLNGRQDVNEIVPSFPAQLLATPTFGSQPLLQLHNNQSSASMQATPTAAPPARSESEGSDTTNPTLVTLYSMLHPTSQSSHPHQHHHTATNNSILTMSSHTLGCPSVGAVSVGDVQAIAAWARHTRVPSAPLPQTNDVTEVDDLAAGYPSADGLLLKTGENMHNDEPTNNEAVQAAFQATYYKELGWLAHPSFARVAAPATPRKAVHVSDSLLMHHHGALARIDPARQMQVPEVLSVTVSAPAVLESQRMAALPSHDSRVAMKHSVDCSDGVDGLSQFGLHGGCVGDSSACLVHPEDDIVAHMARHDSHVDISNASIEPEVGSEILARRSSSDESAASKVTPESDVYATAYDHSLLNTPHVDGHMPSAVSSPRAAAPFLTHEDIHNEGVKGEVHEEGAKQRSHSVRSSSQLTEPSPQRSTPDALAPHAPHQGSATPTYGSRCDDVSVQGASAGGGNPASQAFPCTEAALFNIHAALQQLQRSSRSTIKAAAGVEACDGAQQHAGVIGKRNSCRQPSHSRLGPAPPAFDAQGAAKQATNSNIAHAAWPAPHVQPSILAVAARVKGRNSGSSNAGETRGAVGARASERNSMEAGQLQIPGTGAEWLAVIGGNAGNARTSEFAANQVQVQGKQAGTAQHSQPATPRSQLWIGTACKAPVAADGVVTPVPGSPVQSAARAAHAAFRSVETLQAGSTLAPIQESAMQPARAPCLARTPSNRSSTQGAAHQTTYSDIPIPVSPANRPAGASRPTGVAPQSGNNPITTEVGSPGNPLIYLRPASGMNWSEDGVGPGDAAAASGVDQTGNIPPPQLAMYMPLSCLFQTSKEHAQQHAPGQQQQQQHPRTDGTRTSEDSNIPSTSNASLSQPLDGRNSTSSRRGPRRTLRVSSAQLQEAVKAMLSSPAKPSTSVAIPAAPAHVVAGGHGQGHVAALQAGHHDNSISAPLPSLDLELETLNIAHLESELFGLVLLGRGGGGAVFRAIWQGSQVAVKFMIGKTPASVNLGALEAVLAASVNHPNVVQTYGFDVTKVREHSFNRNCSDGGDGQDRSHSSSLVGGVSGSAKSSSQVVASIMAELQREKLRMQQAAEAVLSQSRCMTPRSGSLDLRHSQAFAGHSGQGYGQTPSGAHNSQTGNLVTGGANSAVDLSFGGHFQSDEGFGEPTEVQPNDSWSMREVLAAMKALPGMYLTHIIMEYCDRGTLLQALQRGVFALGGTAGDTSRFNARVVFRAALRTARDVAHGMTHLHTNDIIHGDLKPGNVLLRGSRNDRRGFVAKVADFGLSKVVTSDLPLEMHHWSTVTHMAPEVVKGTWCKQSDVYSFGVLLWQLMCGEPQPYKHLAVAQVVSGVSQGWLTLPWPRDCHPQVAKLGQACMCHDPLQRPSFLEIAHVLLQIEQNVRDELRYCRSRVCGSSNSTQLTPIGP